MKNLPSIDNDINKLIQSAEKQNKVIRYVGKIDSNGECSINIKMYSKNHSFSNLKGSENIVLFKTQRYNDSPLIVQGPGAGAQVTSGGIFDTASEIERAEDGTILLTFENCNSGTVEYDIPSIDQQGIIPIERVANDNIVLCRVLGE